MYLPALMRLVEVGVDGGLEGTMYAAQAQLADAYIEAGAAEEARFLAEDLVAREPWERANLERFRRALELMGEPDPDGLIAARLSGDSPFTSTDVSVSAVREEVPTPEPDPPPAANQHWEIDNHNFQFEVASFDGPDSGPDAAELPADEDDNSEVDLSVELDDIGGALAAQPADHGSSHMQASADADPEIPFVPATTPTLEAVFARLREGGSQQTTLAVAQADYARGLSLHAAGQVEESIPLLMSASQAPQLRFGTASLLARIYREQGRMDQAVEWFERASQAPPPTPDEGRLLLYDLADVLETTGEYTRALTVCMELQADAGDFRDVADRVNRLTAIQVRG